MGRQDLEHFAVLGDCAAGDFNAAAGQLLGDVLVAERVQRVFLLNQAAHGFLNTFLRLGLAAGGFKARGEKTFIGDRAYLKGEEPKPEQQVLI